METTLVLLNDGVNFERMYYQAICLADPREAERLYARYAASPAWDFWKDAFHAAKLRDTYLMSAILHELDMPFGSYVFGRLDDEAIEIMPWLYADAARAEALRHALDERDADALRACARRLELAADYLDWLKRYNERAAAAEGGHE